MWGEVQDGRTLSGGTVHLYHVICVQVAKILWCVSGVERWQVILVCGNTVEREQVKASRLMTAGQAVSHSWC